MPGPSPIVVGIDFPPCSHRALVQAVRIAGVMGVPVCAIHVIDTLVTIDLQQAMSPFVQDIEQKRP